MNERDFGPVCGLEALKTGQATPAAVLEGQVMDPNVPKHEMVWWARSEIQRLRDEVAVLRDFRESNKRGREEAERQLAEVMRRALDSERREDLERTRRIRVETLHEDHEAKLENVRCLVSGLEQLLWAK